MKLFARLHVIGAVSLVSVLYLIWVISSWHPVTRAMKAWNRSSTHLVVFGDSWSSNKPLLDHSDKEQGMFWLRQSRISGQDKLWIDVLCSEMVCDRLSNFAQSYPSQSVVDDDIFRNATLSLQVESSHELAPDFKAQVKQFISSETESQAAGHIAFTVFFGIWEIWSFAELEASDAERAVSDSVESLFSQIEVLLGSVPKQATPRPTIIVPTVPDPTWFPRWFSERTSSADKFGRLQRQAVDLTELWNGCLEIRAQELEQANVIMPDFDQWILDLMREPQDFVEEGPADTLLEKYGKYTGGQAALVRQPCINLTASADGEFVCSDAARHLFWDDTRLTSAAHEVLGERVFQLVQDFGKDSTSPPPMSKAA